MFVATAAGTSVSSNIDIPANGIIRVVTMGLDIEDASPVTGEGGSAELTFLSSNQLTVNDSRGSICQVSQKTGFADAARLVLAGTPFCVLTPIAIKVAAGERIYLHAVSEGSVLTTAVAYLFIDDGIDVARAQVRRR
jgi:hypothetical protein